MSIDRYIEQIPADQTGVIPLPLERGPGSFLLFQAADDFVTVSLIYDGVRDTFANINGGLIIRRVKPWSNLRIDGNIGTNVTYFIGTEEVDHDETDIRQQVAILAGVSAFAEQPASILSEIAPVVCPSGAQTLVMGGPNFSRRRFTLSVDPQAPGVVFARRGNGGISNLLVMQPGMAYEFKGSYPVDVRNDTGVNVNIYVMEES